MPWGVVINLALLTSAPHEEEEMGGACSMPGEAEKCVQRFGQKT
jgi:hypothetical protein